MANKFVIEVRAKGFTNLESQLKRADKATKGYEKSVGKLRGTTSGLRRRIGALRNNILLYTFAVGAAIKATSTFVTNAAKFEQVRTRLVGLTGSVVKANKAFDTFNAVAATTPFSLDDVVNAGAQLKAFGADAEALIKPITDLAAFMGTTATEAANSFGRAFAGGAGAADILRERGILNIIKTSQGLTDLANTSLPQFREALIKTLQEPTVGIAGSTDRMSRTFTGAMSNMKDSVTRLSATIGDEMLPNLTRASQDIGGLATKIENFIRSFTETEAQTMLRNLKAIGVESKALAGLERLVFTEKTAEQIEEINKQMAKVLNNSPELAKTFRLFGDTIMSFENNPFTGVPIITGIDSVKISSEKAAELLVILKQQMNAVQIEALAMAESIGTNNEATSESTQKAQEQFLALASLVAMLTSQEEIYKRLSDVIAELSVNQDEVTVSIVTYKDAIAALGKQGKLALKAFNTFGDAFAEAALTATTFEQAAKRAINSVAATILSKAATFAMLRMFFPTALGVGVEGKTALGFGDFLAGALGIKHEGGEVQKFASGGVVRGRDNVPILAQAGEFIIRRESAQSIGLNNLRQMNETGQPASVVVNIHGGVVQDDYVRNELIPALNTALTSGARINA